MAHMGEYTLTPVSSESTGLLSSSRTMYAFWIFGVWGILHPTGKLYLEVKVRQPTGSAVLSFD